MNEPPRIFRFGEFELDEGALELRKRGKRVELQPKPLRLLLYLIGHHKRVIGKQELYDQIWPDVIVSESALTSALRDLRRALGDDGRVPELIETRRGRGYRFIATVEELRDLLPGGDVVEETAIRTPPTPFVGRDVELARLGSALEEAF